MHRQSNFWERVGISLADGDKEGGGNEKGGETNEKAWARTSSIGSQPGELVPAKM